MSLRSFYTRLHRVTAVIDPLPKETRLPVIYLQSDASGISYPGYEEQNAEMVRLAKRQGITPDAYCATLDEGPWWEQDGTER